jgi:NAD(P)-dependent dehydrogenase (short-subunit alcohol dehydrogenase family)
MSNEKPVAVVTGSSRGAGRGIAIALGSHGCTVYVSGRSAKPGDHELSGTIYETAQAITAAGGKGIAVRVDHADDNQTKALIDQVRDEQGRLDILVNNACSQYNELTNPGNFWEKPIELIEMLDVGLRSGFVATYHAAPMLVRQRRGLVIFTSSSGGVHYMYGPAYGVHKAGLDKFAADMAVDFKEFNVAALSIWMGGVATERVARIIGRDREKLGHLEKILESPEFTGHIVWALYNDPKIMEISGQTVIGAEMALKYGIKDSGNRQPPSFRDIFNVAPRVQYPVVVR